MTRKQKPMDNTRSLITYLDPRSESSEMYQLIHTNLAFSQVDSVKKVIVVTSSMKEEGKSTTASNLAIASAMAGNRTILIDTDLRLPTLAKRFGLTNLYGLTTVLLKTHTLDYCIHHTALPKLDVLTSGPLPPNPAEILNSRAMHEFLSQLRQEYDLIILDTPPLLGLSDAQILARLADGVIFVVGIGTAKREATLKAKEYLQHSKAHVLGVVVNGVKRVEYYGYSKK